MKVETMARDIVKREGGFVNDPDDPGGATNFGVTIHTMRRMGIDLTGDGKVTTADVKKLTLDHAVEIFMEEYFKRPKIHLLPTTLHDTVFDMYVNAGGNAVKILQRLLVKLGYDVAVDGALGPQTAKHTQVAFDKHGERLRDAYGIARRNYYYGIGDRRPQSRKYARTRAGGKGGWIKRAEEFISPRFHLTEAEHKHRVRAWV